LPEVKKDVWVELAEVFFYAMIPVVLGTGWWVMRRTLLPIDEIAGQIEKINADNLRTPLPCTGNNDEVDRLTRAFNAMTARLDESFRQVQDFTLHASHELKTPLTVMRAELETVLKDTESLPPERAEWIGRQLEEVQRLTKIVEGLTLLAKADAGLVELKLQPVRLGELVREHFEDAQVLAEPHQVKVGLLACEDLTVSGDRHRLRQLLLNLVDNAVKYNRPGGAVIMSLRRVDDKAEVEIINTGKGITPELQARVFDRFARGDNALSGAVEGSGLGLAIAQWIVHAHHGTIQFTSEPNKQTSVVVRLPLAG
jgi:signal transduction histidine kinase